MAKKYTGSLQLDWYNKQRAILIAKESEINSEEVIPAPKVNWVNKDEALFYEIIDDEGRGLSPYWVERNDIRVKEARPLVLQRVYRAIEKDKKGTMPGTQTFFELEEGKKDDENIESFFIRGDNLLALTSVKKLVDTLPDFPRFRCAYYDVPYNTDQAFKHYDDSLEHSEWLTLMRDRLVLTKDLIRDDGCIIVQVDDGEHHYMKILLDEIFGRSNFVNQICYERSGAAGIGQGGVFLNTAEYILIYSKDSTQFSYNELLKNEPLEYATMKRYNKVLSDYGSKKLVEEFTSKSNNLPVKIYKHSNYNIASISLRDFDNRKKEIFIDYLKYFNSIFRTTNPQAENEFQNDLISRMDGGLYSVEYTPSRGKYKDKLTNIFYNNKEIFAWLKDSAFVDGTEIVKSNKMSTIWLHGDIPKADLANEGGVELKRSKKPEQLMKRLFEFATDEGDFILDIFGGSGTSFAVAHKMKRKWVGAEVGKHSDTHILERMKGVINGSDQTGISKALNWRGGGAFKYYHLGPSIIKISKDNTSDFNWSLGKNFIEESLLLSYDYTIDNTINLSADKLFSDKETKPVIGVQKIGSKNRVAIVSLNEPQGSLGNITYDELQSLYYTVKKKYSPEYINIFTNRGIEIAYDSKPDDLEVIKVPHAIFAELEK
ncbi:DNA methyltransferase [Chloroflexota bacterium]